MTQIELLSDVTWWIINFITWSSFAFPVLTWPFWNWSESMWGRNLVAYEVCLGLGFIGATVRHDWGIPSALHGPAFYAVEWLQTISLAFVPLIISWRVIIIWKTQRAGVIVRIAEDIANGDKEEKDTI